MITPLKTLAVALLVRKQTLRTLAHWHSRRPPPLPGFHRNARSDQSVAVAEQMASQPKAAEADISTRSPVGEVPVQMKDLSPRHSRNLGRHQQIRGDRHSIRTGR